MQKRESFDILSIPRSASIEDAKRSYKALVKRWHPDKFEQDSEKQKIAQDKLKEINVAYREVVKALQASSDHAGVVSASESGAEKPDRKVKPRSEETVSIFQKVGLFFRKQKDRKDSRSVHTAPGMEHPGRKRGEPFFKSDDLKEDMPDFQKALNRAIRSQPRQEAGGLQGGRCGGGSGKQRVSRGNRRTVILRQRVQGRRGPVDRIEKIRPVGRIKKIGE